MSEKIQKTDPKPNQCLKKTKQRNQEESVKESEKGDHAR
jgi:hypothetical protein